ncbi:MAG: PD-(D/E)XK nuclease family protein, partial [Leptospiraceae bacterium]|nr:PD-(D/E)XK nuclease family protein [Leptospiraceae bacterium]
SCYSEFDTEDVELGSGRLDLVIEVDNAVIGIENKLFAAFQDNQPEKYQATLTQLAEDLSRIRKREIRPLLIVIAPERRTDEIVKKIGDVANANFLSWEAVVEAFNSVRDDIDPQFNFLLQEFKHYLRKRITFLPDFSKWLPHLQEQFQPNGSPHQLEFLREILKILPIEGYRISTGDDWVGFYLNSDDRNRRNAWLGFVPNERIGITPVNRSSLIVATVFDCRPDRAYFIPQDFKRPIWFPQKGKRYYWIIKLDNSWNSPDAWLKRLKVFYENDDHKEIVI